MQFWNRPGVVLLTYLVVAAALFGPFLRNPFVMDDENQIVGNAHIQDLSKWPSYFVSSTFGSDGGKKMGGIYYKPLMTTYYAAIWHFFGAEPAAFRLPLLLLHVCSAWMVFFFIAAFSPPLIAYFGGLIFLVHPVNCEVIAYIADAQDVLYLFFGLIALVAAARLGSGPARVGVVSLALSLALLSKETGVLFLFLVPFYLFLFRPKQGPAVALVAALLGGAYAFLRFSLGLTQLKNPILFISRATWAERLLTAPSVLWHYVEVCFFPYRVSTVTDFALSSASFSDFWLPLLGLLCFVALLVALGRSLTGQREKRKMFQFSVGILLAWAALHGNLLLTLDGTYADRWFYLGGFAFLLLAALATSRRELTEKKWLIWGTALVLALSVRTAFRLQDWARPIELYKREAAIHPWDAVMTNNVGVELFRGGSVAEAGPYFARAIALNDLWDVAWNNQGAVAQQLGNLEQAVALYEQATNLGAYALAYENYAAILLEMGRINQCREFLSQKALRIFPEDARLLEVAKAVGLTPASRRD